MKPYEKDELMHYASKYYDPVKAHEYYEEHKKLKGRRPTSALSDEGKEVWNYTKNQITEEKKGKVEEAKSTRTEAIAQARTKATETRNRISEKLKSLNEELNRKLGDSKDRIAKQEEARLDQISRHEKAVKTAAAARKDATVQRLLERRGTNLDEAAARINDKRLADVMSDSRMNSQKFTEKMNEERSSVRSDASAKRSAASESVKKQTASNKESAAKQREQVASDLKQSVSAAREAYTKTKESLDSDYETTFQEEYDKILAEYPRLSKSSGGRTSSSKSKSNKLYKFSSTTAKHDTYKNT